MGRSFTLEIDGKKLPVNLEQTENGLSIIMGGKTHNLTLSRKGSHVTVRQDEKLYQVAVKKINSHVFETEMFGEMHLINIQETASGYQPGTETAEASAEQTSQDEFLTVKTPIPGMLVSIDVKPGEEVRHGDCICVIEAMKLYNEIESPYDGTVMEIKASPGTTVMTGDAIAVLATQKTQE